MNSSVRPPNKLISRKMYICIFEGARIAQLVKAWICNLRIAGSIPTAGGVFFWDGPIASHGLGSKSLRGCKRSTLPFSLRAAEFRRVKCKLSA